MNNDIKFSSKNQDMLDGFIWVEIFTEATEHFKRTETSYLLYEGPIETSRIKHPRKDTTCSSIGGPKIW